jgi:hypothetical protein
LRRRFVGPWEGLFGAVATARRRLSLGFRQWRKDAFERTTSSSSRRSEVLVCCLRCEDRCVCSYNVTEGRLEACCLRRRFLGPWEGLFVAVDARIDELGAVDAVGGSMRFLQSMRLDNGSEEAVACSRCEDRCDCSTTARWGLSEALVLERLSCCCCCSVTTALGGCRHC